MTDRPLALLGGHLVPRSSPGADSVLVVGERIEHVGPREEVAARAGEAAEIVELAGRAVVPGFRDAHFHFFQFGLFASRRSLATATSREDVLDAIRDADRSAPGPEPLFLEEWDDTTWRRPEPFERADLDAIAPDRPVIARRVCGHVAIFNGASLARLAGTPGAEDVDRESGRGAEGLVMDLDEIFLPDEEGSRRALAEAARRCLALGITTACDFLRPRAAERYRDLISGDDPGIDLDVYALESCFDVPGLWESLPRGRGFRPRGVKIFTDGSLGGRTAALTEDYSGYPGERGALIHTDEALVASLRRAHDAGRACAVHAIGDRAIAQTLDAFATLPPEGRSDRGHRLEHLELPGPGDLERLRELGVRPCMQPNFVGRWGRPGGLYETALGPERARRMNPIRSALAADTGVFFGSDGMPASPLFGIRSAVHHPVETERCDVDAAVRLSTEAAAAAIPAAGHTGRIEAGSVADLAVLPVGPDALAGQDPDDGPDLVDLTVRRGRLVHRRATP